MGIELSKHQDIYINGNRVFVIKENGVEKWRRHFYISFSGDRWSKNETISVPFESDIDYNNGVITISFNNNVLYTNTISIPSSSIATASSTTGYRNYMSFEPYYSVVSDYDINPTLYSTPNYWVSFATSNSTYGSVNQTGFAVEKGDAISITSNKLTINKLNSDFSKTSTTCTASAAAAYNGSSSTSDDKNTSTGLWKKVTTTPKYTPAFSSWSIASGTKITDPTTITANFTASTSNQKSESIYGYAVWLYNNMSSVSGTYSGSSVSLSSKFGQLYIDDTTNTNPTSSNTLANRQAVGSTYYWAAKNSTFYVISKSISSDGTNSSGTTIYPSTTITGDLGNATSGGYTSSTGYYGITMTAGTSNVKNSGQITLSKPFKFTLTGGGSGTTITEASASANSYPAKSSGSVSVSANWSKTLTRTQGLASLNIGWRGTYNSFSVTNGSSWSGTAKITYSGSSASYITISKIEYTDTYIKATATKQYTTSTNYNFNISGASVAVYHP